MSKERIDYLDEIKGISILLVVFCHYVLLPSETLIGNILMCIAWGAVPCFFMVTGGLLHNPCEFKWSRWRYRLLKTYTVLFIWKSLYLVCNLLTCQTAFTKTQCIQYLFFCEDMGNDLFGVFWFMHAYLMLIIFLPISHFLFNSVEEGKKILLFTVGLLFIGGLGLPSGNMLVYVLAKSMNKDAVSIMGFSKIIPFGNLWQNMLFYFLLGALLLKYHINIKNIFEKVPWKKGAIYSMFFIGTSGLILLKYFQTGTVQWGGQYLSNGYSWISTGLVSIAVYVFFLIRRRKNLLDKGLQYLGRNTMGIYYIHYPLCNIFLKLWNYYQRPYSVFYNILKTIIVVIICVLIVEIAKKIPIIKSLVI